MMTGNVKRVIEHHGYGFITSDDGDDYFFHITNVNGEKREMPQPGQIVMFDTKASSKGIEAVDISVIE